MFRLRVDHTLQTNDGTDIALMALEHTDKGTLYIGRKMGTRIRRYLYAIAFYDEIDNQFKVGDYTAQGFTGDAFNDAALVEWNHRTPDEVYHPGAILD